MKTKQILAGLLAIAGSNFLIAQNTAYDINGPTPIFGTNSTAFGSQALFNNSGTENVANGYQSLFSNNSGSFNTANGAYSLFNNITGSSNSANGYQALFLNDQGGANVANGYWSLYNNTGGNFNVAHGSLALYSNKQGSYNVANGTAALFYNTADNNVANGAYALYSNTTGNYNVANGSSALYFNISGLNNTANGSFALNSNTYGNSNTSNGSKSLAQNLTGNYNAANGVEALYSNKDGHDNVANGYQSLYKSVGNYNTANGSGALYSNNTHGNTADGYMALHLNTTGSGNVGTGMNALFLNVSGDNNTANGTYALEHNIASSNSAFGFNALRANSSGALNTAVGQDALGYNYSGNYNSAVGLSALGWNVSGSGNTAHGYQALQQNTGDWNTGIGVETLFNNTSGGFNSTCGFHALYANTTGSFNTGVGYLSNVSSASFTNATAVGSKAVTNAKDRVWLGDAASTVWTTTSYNISDGRFKKNIKTEDVKGLEFIKLLRPVVYNFDVEKFTEHITQNMADSLREKYTKRDFKAATELRQSGFIAQEVEEAAKKSGYNFSGVYAPDANNNTDTYGISYYQFVVPLVKAVQEQQKMIEDQKQVNEKLLNRIEALEQANANNKVGNATGINTLQTPDANSVMQQNEPNPFTNETIIKYNLTDKSANAYLAVYDLSGKQITTFPIDQNSNSIVITSEKLSAGIYLYSIVSNGKILDSKRMVVANK